DVPKSDQFVGLM
uniref:Kassinin n=2 Tax=Kassina senegalensis TaxID=8415 RepID=TKN_KASSE|nr:RecName: Full=Kassinin [Kassina senegalensis]1MYU_A Chain A, Kassinin [Kassina senegalensis]